MNNRKYPTELFIFGLITNFFFHFFWIFIPAIILLIIGIWANMCLYIGIALLVFDLFLSLAEQLKIRNTFLSDSDNPGFNKVQDAFSKDGNWRNNLKEVIEQNAEKAEEQKTNDEADETSKE